MNQLLTRIIAFVFLLTGFEAPLFSQAPSIQWQKSYGGSNYDEMNGGDPYLLTSDGGFLINGVSSSTDGDVTGNHGSYDFWLLKSDANGNISWQKSLGGSNYDNGVAAEPTTDGGYILVGYSGSNDGDVSGNHGSYDGWIAKLDANRNIVWQKSLGGSNFDYLWSIQQTSDGGYIAAGETSSNDGDVSGNHGSSDAWVVRLDANGNIIWKRCYGGSNSDGANSIQQTSDGGYIVGGSSASHNGDVTSNSGSGDYWILKLDPFGNIIWQKSFGGSGGDDCQSIRQTSDGGYIAAGYSTSNDGIVSGNHGGGDDWLIKLDANGSLIWNKTLGGSGGEYTYSAEQTSDGGYIVGGYTTSNDGDVTNNHGGTDYWVVKLDASGNISWQKTLGGSGNDYGQNAVPTSDGGYIISGFSDSNDGDVTGNHGNPDYWMVKLSTCTSASVPTITASINPVCSNTSTTLSISSGNLNSNTQWQWYSGGCGSENGGTSTGSGTSITVSPTATTTYYARGEGGCAVGSCGSIPVNVTPAPGDPSVFGNNDWNVYAWNAGGLSDTGTSWNTNYSGYYVDTNFNFNTESRWNRLGAPSDASGYLGCPVADDNHSWSAKRTGFPCGYYRIDIPGHDDEGELFINGVEVWFHDDCCDSHTGVWYGFLGNTSSVEFRVTEGAGESYGSITFNSLATIVSSAIALDCKSSSITLSAIAQGSYSWNTGATSSSITVNTAGTYSVNISDGSGCTISNSYNVINNTASLTGPNCLGGGNLTASFIPTIEKVEWRRNDTILQTKYSTYNPVAGSAIGSLSNDEAVFVDNANNVYASDGSNSQVLKWSPGNPVPTVVAGGNGYGGGANQLASPRGIYVDQDFNVYVVDNVNYRVQKWAPGATSGVTVAGGNGYGNGANQIAYGEALTLDHAGNIYISDISNARVSKWAPGASSGITVAGGNGSGSALNQFVYAAAISLDDSGNLYIADATNNRIMKWAPGATSGVVVAGGNGYGSNLNQLENPQGVTVDHYGNIFISNYDISNIVKWAPGATTGTIVTGACCSGSGTGFNVGLALGNDGSFYICDTYNGRVFKYPMTPSSITPTFTPTTAGSYKLVTYSFDGCVLNSNTINIYPKPTVNITGNPYFCSGGSTTLDAGNHQQYSWSNGSTTETTTINSDGNYSVTVTDSGCSTTSPTLAVYSHTPVITITPTPSSVCTGNSSQLNTLIDFGGGVKSSKTYYINASQLLGMPNSCSNGGQWGYSSGNLGFSFRDSGVGRVASIKLELYVGSNTDPYGQQLILNNTIEGYLISSSTGQCMAPSPGNYVSVDVDTFNYAVGGNNTLTFTNFQYFGLVPGPNTNNYYAKVIVNYFIPPTTYSWEPTGDTIKDPIVSPLTTSTYTVTATTTGCVGTQTTTVAVNPPPGDTTVFGNNAWNVYVYNDGGQNDNTGHSWSDKYSGYYTDTSFNFNTENMWNRNGAPSDASTYNGCPVDDDNHSWSAKRKGFPCGTYQIDVPGHDDEAQLFVNDSMVWEHIGCCDSHTNVWTGFLDNNSTIVFRGTEGSEASYGSINIIFKSGISTSGPTTFCPGYSLQLTADSGNSYLWNTGATTKSITVDTSGNYSVNITLNGCTHTFSQQVTVAALDTPTIYSNTNFAYCPIDQGGNLYIIPDPRIHTILWSNGIPFPGINVPSGNYSVTVSDALGCSATSHATMVNNAAGTDSSFGANAWKVNAYAQGYYIYNGGYGYYYSGGREWDPQDYSGYCIDTTLNFNSQNQWNPSGTPSNASGYLGCAVTNDIMSWSAKRRGFACGVYQIDVTSHDDNAQLWIDGVMVWEDPGCCNPKINAWTGPLNASSTVEFKVNDQGGGSSGSLQFTQLDSTANFVTLTGHPLVCTGQSQLLTSSILGNYLWSNGTTVNPASISQSGNYSVTVTDLNGCVLTSAPVSVSILPNAAPVAHITAPITNLCNWNSATLSSDSTTGNLWSTTETTQTISANIPNDYMLTVTNSAGCYDQDTVHITGGFTPPTPIAGNGGSICSGTSATLTASGLAPGGQVASFNGTNQYIDVTQNIPENNFTIEMWVKTTAPNTGIFSVTSGPLGAYGNDRHFFLYNGILYTRVYNSNTLNSGIKINDGHWHHIALTVQSGTGQKIYIDGALSPNTSSYDHSDFTNQTDFLIGFSSDAMSPYFNGTIDNVRIWSEARTQQAIQNNMAHETPLSTDNLVYASPLNGNLNVTAGNVGTVPNGISYAAPDYYTYSWTGTGAPAPSTSETQTTSALTSGGSYSVTASIGGNCSPSNSASTNVDVTTAIAYYPDVDGDGYGSSTATPILTCTNPGAGYVTNNLDCNDSNINVHPGVTEVCNGIDDDCNGQIDEGVGSTFYADVDGDGYGNPASSVQACSAPAGYVSDHTDCNDANANVHPGATEICNGIDDNCNGQIDEGVGSTFYADVDGDGYGNPASSVQACSAPAGYVLDHTDCNDANANVHPGAIEICNNIDDNCNGQIDEGVKTTFYADVDGDGYGTSTSSVQACTVPQGYVSDNTDCNDGNANVHPGAADICNGIDDNCNGVIDENAITATITPNGTITFCAGSNITLTANSGSGISYQWLKNNKNISGATKQTYTTAANGNYQVKENNSFSCSSTSVSASLTKVAKPAAVIIALGNLNICTTGSVKLQANAGAGLKYQWIKGAANISGATARTYVATAKGTYKCIVTNASNCSKTSNSLKVTNSCIKDGEPDDNLAQSTLLIYPNPTEGKFMLDLKTDEVSDGQAKIMVMNMVGQIVYAENGSIVNGELRQEINFPASASSGIYIAKVICNDHTYQGKLIYQH